MNLGCPSAAVAATVVAFLLFLVTATATGEIVESEKVVSVAKTRATGAGTNGDLVELVGVVWRFAFSIGLGSAKAIGVVEHFTVEDESSAIAADVAVIAFYILGVHRHETKYQQVHASGNHG